MHLEAAAAAEMRRGGRSMQQRGSRTTKRSPGSYGARTRRQAVRVHSSPPGAGLGRLRDDVAAVETGNRRRWRLVFPAAHGQAKAARVGNPRGRRAA
jgi:hypothetical protein